MAISKKQRHTMFIVWLFIFIPSIFIAHNYFPSREIDVVNIIILFLITLIIIFLPLKAQDVTVSFERWITLAVFLQYGVFTEFIFIQVAVLASLFAKKSTLPLLYKFFVNSSMFSIVSIVSGFVFHYAGGVIGSLVFSQLLFYAFLYVLTYTVLNNLLLKLYFHLNWRVYSLRSNDAIWDYIAAVILLPFSISLYFLHEYLGNESLLLVGIPLVIILLVVRRYNTSNNLNEQLSQSVKIGHELADRLLFREVIQTFLEMMTNIVPYENAYVVDYRKKGKLIPLMAAESGVIMDDVEGINFPENKQLNDGLSSVLSKIYYNESEVNSLKNIEFKNKVVSAVTSPIIRNGTTEGYLIMTSSRKNAFQADDIKIIDILTGYFSISLEKARYYENTIKKSERCGLTKLYNYRYLVSNLETQMLAYHKNEISHLSVIMLDIDHFKKVNNTYGHESGNDILISLSNLLKKITRAHDVVARYGGEEFVIVLPGCSKEDAANLAEVIRVKVENTIFKIIPDLSESRMPIDVNITISLGVATVPEDAEDTKSLLRNADRALYIGGKQAGRNRVGLYQIEEVLIP